MAAIIMPTLDSYGVDSFTPVELTGTDTLTPKQGTLYVYNASVSAVDLVIDGDGGTTVDTPTTGPVDVSGGFTMACPAGDVTKLKLGDISGYLTGDVDVTGGDADVFAWVL